MGQLQMFSLFPNSHSCKRQGRTLASSVAHSHKAGLAVLGKELDQNQALLCAGQGLSPGATPGPQLILDKGLECDVQLSPGALTTHRHMVGTQVLQG